MSYVRRYINQQYFERFGEADPLYVANKILDDDETYFRDDIATILYALDNQGKECIRKYLVQTSHGREIFTKHNFSVFLEMLKMLEQQDQIAAYPKNYYGSEIETIIELKKKQK